MSFLLKDRVQETCNSPGTGTISLLGANTGYQTFSSAIGNGNFTYYAIADQGGNNWEVGYGTYSTSGNTLTRTTVLSSSNGGSLTNFSSGIQNVWVDYPASKAVYLDSSGNLVFDGTTTTSNLKLGNNLDTNGQLIYGGNYGGNQLSLPVGFGPFLQGLFEGNVNLRAGSAGTATGGFTLTSDGALGLGTSPAYGSVGQVLTSGGSSSTANWTTPTVGDVVGPSSATDNAIARYDGTTGKLIQNSVVTVSDTGAVTGFTTASASTSVTTPIVQASNSGGLALKNSGGTTQMSVGAGGGDNMSINVSTNINGTNAQIDISPTGTGHVHMKPSGTGSIEIAPTNVGTMDNMTIGATTPRAITGTTVTATSFVGSGASLTNVVNSLAASTGISVSGSTGAVTVTNTAPDQTVTIASGTGISATGTYPAFTVTNTAPDQTVAIASGTGISVSGTYPNFTVTNTAPSSGGTVTSVTGTTPIVSSGGNTPAISIPAATTSVSGYLTSTDWTTFNNKTSNTGTVTSVGGTGTVNGLTLTGTVTTSGSLTLGGTLDLSAPPAIGGTTPNTGKFTSVTDTGLTSGRVTYATTGGLLQDSANMVFDGSTLTTLNSAYTGTLTGGTGVVNLGSGQFYKDASGLVGIGTSSPYKHLSVTQASSTSYSTSDFDQDYLALQVANTTNDKATGIYFAVGSNGEAAISAVETSDAETALTFGTRGGGSRLERMRIDSSGNLLVGTTTAFLYNQNTVNGISNVPGTSSSVQISTDPAASTANASLYLNMRNTPINGAKFVRCFYNGTAEVGSISLNGTTGVLYNLSSDHRLKNNATPLTGSSEFIMALQPKTWDWWDGSGKGVGFIAHEFMEVAKYSGNGKKDEVETVDDVDTEGKVIGTKEVPKYQSIQPSSSEVMANLVALVQEQQALIESLTTRLTVLEAK